MVEGKKRSD
jgi:hypothetical protein